MTVNGRPRNVDYYNYMEIEDLDEDDKVMIFTSGFEGSGVSGVNEEKTTGKDVYDIYGIIVMRNATLEQTLSLPKGLYIRGGQKIFVR